MLLGRLNSSRLKDAVAFGIGALLVGVGAAWSPLAGQVPDTPTESRAVVPVETAQTLPAWVPFAHPRAVQSFIGAYHNDGAPVESQLVAMGLGDGIYFTARSSGSWSYRIGLAAVVRGVFDAGVSSFDFLAADFIVGIPIYLERGNWTSRFRLYHQSSHAGDDLLGREDVLADSHAYDFEAVEVFVVREFGQANAYAGLESRWRRTPGEQPAVLPHLGLEIHPRARAGGVSPVFGAHVTWTGNGRDPSLNLRSGVLWTRAPMANLGRPVGLFVELRTGPAVAGRFLGQERTSIGVAVQVGMRGR